MEYNRGRLNDSAAHGCRRRPAAGDLRAGVAGEEAREDEAGGLLAEAVLSRHRHLWGCIRESDCHAACWHSSTALYQVSDHTQ